MRGMRAETISTMDCKLGVFATREIEAQAIKQLQQACVYSIQTSSVYIGRQAKYPSRSEGFQLLGLIR